jgi:hypothetical protein
MKYEAGVIGPYFLDDMVRRNGSIVDRDTTHAPWQLEPSWPRRSGVQEQRLAEPIDSRLMRMAKDADIRVGFLEKRSTALCELPALIQNMTDRNAAACQFDYGLGRKYVLFTIIDVAGNGGERRDLFQLLDDRPLANIPGVENVIDVSEVSPNGRIEQAMGIGNHSDQNAFALVHGAAAG